jgi:hypothetical protein
MALVLELENRRGNLRILAAYGIDVLIFEDLPHELGVTGRNIANQCFRSAARRLLRVRRCFANEA